MSEGAVQHRETFTALGEDGYSPAIRVTNFKDVSFSLAGADTSVLTVEVLGSLKEVAPNFESAAIPGNEWQTIICQGYEDDTAIEGDAGIPFTENGVKLFSVNVDGLDWVAFKVSAWTSGTVLPKISLHNN